MITVRGTQDPKSESTERARFAFADPEKYSRLPLVFVLVMGGIVAYLKSALSIDGAEVKASAAPDAPPPHGEKPPAPQFLPQGMERSAVEETATEPDEPSHPARSSHHSLVVPLFPRDPSSHSIIDLALFDLPPIDFSSSAPPPPLSHPFGQPVNDNGPSGSVSTAAPVAPSLKSAGVVQETEDEDDPSGPPTAPPPATSRRNTAPSSSAPVKLADVFAGQVTLIALSELLLNTVDAEGSELFIAAMEPSTGQIRLDDGMWTYQANLGVTGIVTLTYEVSDGEMTSLQHATFNVRRDARIEGTDSDDLLAGTPLDDEIDAGAGADLVEAGAGHDTVSGGAGDDHIVGGDGNDVIYGGPGDDVIFAGAGNDVVFGDGGNDRIFGEAGEDTLDGGDGDDLLYGGEGNDVLLAGDGNDEVHGDGGDDVLQGGDGDDLLIDGAGRDTVAGGAGDDVIRVSLDADADTYLGGDGHDTLDLSLTTLGVEIDFEDGRIEGIEISADRIDGFEAAKGGTGDDTFIAGSIATVLQGGGGDDTFVFRTGPMDPDAANQLIHEILDLTVGDRILVPDFELTQLEREGAEDKFERAYAGRDEDDNPYRLRIRYEQYGDAEHTIIDVDLDADHDYELAIDVATTYRLFVYETA